ncbi:hypothetical protein [Pedobacter panaciterrae]
MQLALYSLIVIGIIIYLLRRHYGNTSKIELNHSQANRFTTQNLPFVYQSEYYSLAWGLEQKGFYVDPEGRTYKYKMPEKWHRYKTNTGKHSWGFETDGTISATELFENLKSSVEDKPLFEFLRKTNPITQALIYDLLTSTIEDRGQVQCDSGNTSNSLFVYDSEIDLYRRILLTCDGDNELVNQSVYTKQIIQGFGIVRR